jgi:8-oxo-dGTP diphosphatase
VLLTISGQFSRLVIEYLHNRWPGAPFIPLIVMRGGALFLDALWRGAPSSQLGLCLPVRRSESRDMVMVYSEVPSACDAHYVVFDLIANSGETMEGVLRSLYKARSMGLPEPMTVQIAVPFSTVSAASRIREQFPDVTLHTIWNGLRRRSNGWLTGLDFDAGDLAFGGEGRVIALSGEYIHLVSRSAPSHSITKVAGLIRKDGRLLVVRKHPPDRKEFIMPGGKPLPGESQEATLRRELAEELDVQIGGIRWFGWFEEEATFEGVPMAMDVYEVEPQGVPRPSSEIVEIKWINQSYEEEGVFVGNLLSKGVLPALHRLNAL